jgi:hypothetical protein
MNTQISIVKGEPYVVVENEKTLKLKNYDDKDYEVDLNPRTVTETKLPVELEANKNNLPIKIDNTKKGSEFELIITEKLTAGESSKKKTNKDQVRPRMIIKVE